MKNLFGCTLIKADSRGDALPSSDLGHPYRQTHTLSRVMKVKCNHIPHARNKCARGIRNFDNVLVTVIHVNELSPLCIYGACTRFCTRLCVLIEMEQ